MPLVPLCINLLVIAISAGLGYALRKNRRARIAALAAALAIGALAYFAPSRPDISLRLFPFASSIFFSNLYPLAAAIAFIPTVQFGKTKFHKIRIAVLMTCLFAVSLLPFAYFWKSPAYTEALNIDANGICRQTSTDTCAAAAVVTLLSRYDIETTEAEVVRLALTKKDIGTRTLGQYRAMKLLTRNRPDLKVRVAKLTPDELIALNRPAIITVGLQKRFMSKQRSKEEEDLENLYQWRPGVMHDVVFLGPMPDDPTRVQIGEPDFGLEKWWRYQLDILFTGYTIYLEESNAPS